MEKKSDDDVRALFVQIGCVMEDASVVALIWNAADALTPKDRLKQLTQAHDQIGEALQNIKSNLETH